ncbi:helix-turn-helix transcriptional regulator [Pseudomonas aegrilactucae]|uniref:helix-turn-helix transcriptional regulator n=1 Tax=Pseudomonas aegrilactucae TaxID=2854028 RepID=UPI0020D1F91A|nr:AraC family transcriptional regulator [Pseudomonas aegrilactucae]
MPLALITEHLHACGLVESSWVKASAAQFARHTHEEYVLGANLSGHERIWLDGRSLDVAPGQVTLYNPLAVQASEFGPQGVEYISLHLAPDALAQVTGDSHRARPHFAQGAFDQPALYRAIVDFAHSTRFEPARQEEALLALLAQLLEHAPGTPGEHQASLRHSLGLMADTLDRKLELDELAQRAGLSKYHFVRSFKKATGLAPLQYHMQLRLIEARRCLRAGVHPLDVAARLGFYDQSHFINSFRRVMGATPNHYWLACKPS